MESRFFRPGSFAALNAFLPAAGPAVAEPPDGLAAVHAPPLEPRDEAVFLLTATAEIEHALMVQYLYAAYSIHPTGPNAAELAELSDVLVQIAREEMGHLITVQNLLHLVGGPLNMGRDRAPYGSEIYPFRFTLEPVTRGSLAKYVTAESPVVKPDHISDEDWALVGRLAQAAKAANDDTDVRHVGVVYARLAVLFGDPVAGLADTDFRTDTATVQASREDWGLTPLDTADGSPLLVDDFVGTDVAALRQAALAAVKEIAEQGEGFDQPTNGPESHFERFLDIYKRVSALIDQQNPVTWPIATDPNTSSAPTTIPTDPIGSATETAAARGRITEPRARAWAQLFDLRYRMLLGRLAHFLRVDQECYLAATGPQQGDRTARGLLLLGAFDEMRHLKKIAHKLVQLPKDPGGSVNAGPPFELPYTLSLPDGEGARWRMHLDVSRAASRLVADQLTDDDDPFLAALTARDQADQTTMAALAAGGTVPPEAPPTGFAKAVTILEEAVRGFGLRCPHSTFWVGKTRDAFVATEVPNEGLDVAPVALDATGAVVADPTQAPLIQRLSATDPAVRMPRSRPAVPASRLAYLEQWVRDGAPDDSPPGRVGVVAEPETIDEPGQVVDPHPPGFTADIAPLFRQHDRDEMAFLFDLGSLDDVRANATDILNAVDTGFMPCDKADRWPPERVALLRRWVDGGMLP